MNSLIPLLLSFAVMMPQFEGSIQELYLRLQNKYPAGQTEKWTVKRISEEENTLLRTALGVSQVRADNYVIFETKSAKVIKDLQQQLKKVKTDYEYRLVYEKDQLPDLTVKIFAHISGNTWAKFYAVLIQKNKAFFVYIDGALPDALYQKHRKDVHALIDHFAEYLSAQTKE